MRQQRQCRSGSQASIGAAALARHRAMRRRSGRRAIFVSLRRPAVAHLRQRVEGEVEDEKEEE